MLLNVTHLVICRWISVTLTLSSEDEILRGVFYIACEYTRGGKPFGQWPLIFATIFNGTIQSHWTDWWEFWKIVYLDEEYFSLIILQQRRTFSSRRLCDMACDMAPISLYLALQQLPTTNFYLEFLLRNGISPWDVVAFDGCIHVT